MTEILVETDDGEYVWVKVGDLAVKPTNSAGNTDSDVRKFCREHGIKPSADNVETIGREVRRTERENEHVERRWKEQGRPRLADNKGRDVEALRKAQVQRELAKRNEPKP